MIEFFKRRYYEFKLARAGVEVTRYSDGNKVHYTTPDGEKNSQSYGKKCSDTMRHILNRYSTKKPTDPFNGMTKKGRNQLMEIEADGMGASVHITSQKGYTGLLRREVNLTNVWIQVGNGIVVDVNSRNPDRAADTAYTRYQDWKLRRT